MIFQQENLIDVIDELTSLVVTHHLEISKYKDIPANPDFEMYFNLEKLGFFRMFTARDEQTKMIGYMVIIVRESMHYNVLTAYQDSWFITPSQRGFGARFLEWVEYQLRNTNVKMIYQNVTTRMDFSPMLLRNGYEETERVFVKRLAD